MTKAQLFRLAGLASLVGGAALIVFALFHPERHVELALEPSWVWEHQLGVLAFVLMPFGLLGIYGVQANKSGRLGLAAFVIAFAGAILYMGGVFMDAYFSPTLASAAPEVVTSVLTAQLSGAPLIGLGLASLAFTGGLVLLGLVTYRTGVLPRWGGLLLIIGGPLFAPGSLLPKPVQVSGAVVLGAGFIWLGYALFAARHNT